MAIKLADTLAPMSGFPAAMAEHIGFSDGANLQEKFDNKELGGGDSSVTLTQEEFDALDEQTKLENDYRCYDTGRLYYKGVRYGHDKPETIEGFSKFKEMKEAGLIDDEEEYIVSANAEGILLEASDIGYSNAVSNLSCTTVQGAVDKVNDKVDNLIDDEVSDSTVWSSKKTSDELKGKLLTTQIAPNSLGFDVGSTVTLEEFLRAIYNKYGTSGTFGFWWSGSNEIYVEHNGTKVKINGGIFTWQSTNINVGWQHMTAIYAPNSSANTMYKMFLNTGEEAGTIISQGIEVIPTISDTSSTTSTYSSAKIDEKTTALNKRIQGGTPFYEMYFNESRYRKLTVDLYYGREVTFSVNNLGYEGIISVYSNSDSASACVVKNIGVRGNPQGNISVKWGNYKTLGGGGHYQVDLFIYKVNASNTMIIRPRTQQIDGYTKVYTSADFVTSSQTEYEAAEYTAITEYESINDSSNGNAYSTWSSSKIAQQDGIKQVFYASATSYPSIFWVLSDATTGVFWFKHTLSDSAGVKSVEGYADLTHDTVRLISGSDISAAVGTDTTSGKKGVRFTASWGDSSTTSCKITEVRPVTAIPTQIVTR